MWSNKRKRVLGLLAVIWAILVVAVLTLNLNQVKANADTSVKDTVQHTATLNDSFSDDCILVVLDKNYSQYRGINSTVSHQLYTLGAESIKNLTELPENYINEDGTINREAAVEIANHYDNVAFQQILQVMLKEKGKNYVLNAVEKAEKIKGVSSAEPDFIYENNIDWPDTYYSEQWALNGDYGVNAKEAWKYTKGSKNVRVGIIDTGIASHEDLNANVVAGYDYVNKNYVTTDDDAGHGTAVAGIIGAVSWNGKGISGIAPNVSLVPLQTAHDMSDKGTHRTSDRITAIQEATNKRIPVINHSIAGFCENTSILAAIKDYSGLFVWSAGNNGSNLSSELNAFQFLNIDNLISVGMLDSDGTRNQDSNYSATYVDLFAPGGSVITTYPTNICETICHKPDSELSKTEKKKKDSHYSDGYHVMSGTSFAAPYVTGVAALLLSVDNTLTGAELKDIICKTVQKQDNLTNYCRTSGRLDANNALRYLAEGSTVTFDKQGGSSGTNYVVTYLNEQLPEAEAPSRKGYNFMGYFTEPEGHGVKYYDENMSGTVWDREGRNQTLYAHWEIKTCKIYIRGADFDQTISLKYGEKIPESYAPVKSDHKFIGLFSNTNGKGTKYARAEIKREYGRYTMKMIGEIPWNNNGDGTLYAHFERMEMDFQITQKDDANPSNVLGTYSQKLISGQNNVLTAPEYSGYEFAYWIYNDLTYEESTLTKEVRLHISETTGEVAIYHDTWGGDGNIEIIYSKKSCVAEGTLITLADGSQVPVESLTGDEMLLVWNLHTGSFDIAPILLIDKDPAREYKIINLSFSDGTSVKVISEHGFWDFDLNRYVYLDENAAEYLGHWFNKQYTEADGSFAYKKVQLTDVDITFEYTTAWSPETYGHLCYYVNGMLSMPGGSTGLFNIFEVDAETMRYDEEAFARDIEQYGLFTYEEFNELLPVPEFVFEAYNGQYLKVAIGKGLITMEGLQQLAERYLGFFE